MVLPTTHLAAGLSIAYLVSLFSPGLETSWLWVGMVAGELPDIDFVWFGIFNKFTLGKQSYKHRTDWFHTPWLYLVVALPLLAFWGWEVAIIFLFGVWSHLLLDSIDCSWGIKWLWPVSDNRFRVFVKHHNLLRFKPEDVAKFVRPQRNNECLHNFWSLRNWQFWFEIVISLWFLWQFGKII